MKHIKLLAYNVFIVILLLGIIELSVRYFVPEIQLSGTSAKLFSENIYYNSLGLNPGTAGLSNGQIKYVDNNGFWKYHEKHKGKRILLLGDSVTMGIGVDNDSTFAGIINNSLDSVVIYNPSLIAYNGNDYLNLLKALIDDNENKIGFEKIIVCWTLNDLYPDHPIEDAPGIVEDGIIKTVTSFFRNNSYTFHYLKNLFSDRAQAYYRYDSDLYRHRQEFIGNFSNNLDEYKYIASKYNIELSIVLMPYEYQLRTKGNENVNYPQDMVLDLLTEKGIQSINALKAFNNLSDSGRYYLYGDGIHFSNSGHRVLAKFLLNRLIF